MRDLCCQLPKVTLNSPQVCRTFVAQVTSINQVLSYGGLPLWCGLDVGRPIEFPERFLRPPEMPAPARHGGEPTLLPPAADHHGDGGWNPRRALPAVRWTRPGARRSPGDPQVLLGCRPRRRSPLCPLNVNDELRLYFLLVIKYSLSMEMKHKCMHVLFPLNGWSFSFLNR